MGFLEPDGRQPVVALLVQHQPGVDGSFAPLQGGDHLLCPVHLGHQVTADEAHCLDPRDA